jgi:carbonic anhydrase
VERNVDFQVKYCVNKYKDIIEAGKLVVVGAVYDFLNAYGHGEGRVVITNLNGVTCPNKIKASEAMSDVSDTLRNVVVDRKTDGR